MHACSSSQQKLFHLDIGPACLNQDETLENTPEVVDRHTVFLREPVFQFKTTIEDTGEISVLCYGKLVLQVSS